MSEKKQKLTFEGEAERNYNGDELTFDQEVFGVEGTAGQMEQNEINNYYERIKRKQKPAGNPYAYGYRP